MKKIFIIDAVNLLFRAYHAIAPMTGIKGQSTHALFGFIRSVLKIITTFSPDYVVAVFDGPNNKKRRTELYKDYKIHRVSMPEDLFAQLEQAVFFCELAGIPTLMIPEVEADDTIGTLAKWTERQKLETYICSSDKDLCQLVSNSTFLVHLHKENAIVNSDKVLELFGVRPDQIVDYLALIGDTSDNIPGVPGIGPKTASSLLEEFGTLETILSSINNLTGKKQELLLKGKENAILSHKLASLHFDVEIPYDLSYYERKPSSAELRNFYQENRFLSLLKEEKTEELPKIAVSYKLISSKDELEALFLLLQTKSSLCFDTETTALAPMEGKLVGIGIGYQPGEAWYIPLNATLSKKEIIHFLTRLFSQKNLSFYGHNIKYDLHILLNEDLPLPRIDFDTILASYLLTPHIVKHNLDELTLERFSHTKIPIEQLIGKGKKQLSMGQVDVDLVKNYCCEDVDYTMRLKQVFEKELEEKNLLSLLYDVELPLVTILLGMERKGLFLDLPKIREISHHLSHKIAKLEKEIHEIAGEPFNVNSPKQLAVILFEKLKLKPPKKTQTGFSTAADVLESLEKDSPIVRLILEYRQMEKLRSTYADALQEQVNPFTGRIHCTFNQSVTATGRLSCQAPNLQNIPTRSDEGKKIRSAFQPEKTGWSYLSADYSQIELRLLAHLSEDPILIKAFLSGEDIHAHTASVIFSTPLDQVTPLMRYRAKAVNFGVLYGQQAFGLSQGLSIEFKEAEAFIETYFERYPKIKNYLESCKEKARKTGYALTMTGRKRPIPEINSKNPALRSLAERLAINTPLQGSAADLIKLAMIHIAEKWPFEKSFMILQIHDELLFECPDEEIEVVASFVKEKMESVFRLHVPLLVDISVGKNWGDC